MKKRTPLDPNARICPCCGYANIAAVSVCRLCATRLPEQLSLEELPLETPVPPAYQPLPYRSRPPVPATLKPLPHRSQPPESPPLPRQEKPRAIADGSVRWARGLIVLPLAAISALQRRIRSLGERRQHRRKPDLLIRQAPRPFRTQPSIVVVVTRMVGQTRCGLLAFILFLGQKARALKPRFPSWRPRLKFSAPSLNLKLNLTPAMRFGRQAFFFLAGLGGMALKALLSAVIFLLKQSHQLLKLLWSFRAVKPAVNPTMRFDLRRAAKYGGGVLAALAVLAFLGLSFVTLQRSWASWRTAKAVTGEIKIEEDYQSASQRTWVKLEPLQVMGEKFDGLSLGASFSYPGRKLRQEPGSITLLLTSVAEGFKYAEQRALTVRADWDTIKLGVMNRNSQQVAVSSDGKIEVVKPGKKSGYKSDRVLETLTINVPTVTWTKIARSKEVKMKLGQTEFELGDTHLTAWRDMLERATPELPAAKRASR